jgi:hypothetical protein
VTIEELEDSAKIKREKQRERERELEVRVLQGK